jgi:hypothetical protein
VNKLPLDGLEADFPVATTDINHRVGDHFCFWAAYTPRKFEA